MTYWNGFVGGEDVHYLTWLEPVIGSRVTPESIGNVVFVRANLELTADHGLLTAVAAAGLGNAARWIQAEPSSVYAQGGVKEGYVSLLAEFANGASALISAEAAHGEPSAQLLLVGQRGTLRYDDYPQAGQLKDRPLARAEWVRWIERSLRLGAPAKERE